MNHPTPEDWMTLLYGEAPAGRRAELKAHLRQCPACAAQVQGWQAGRGALDAWALPAANATPRRGVARRWAAAAAAAILLLGGIALGRFSAASSLAARQADFDARLVALRTELRAAAQEDTQRLLASFAHDLEERLGSESAGYLAALQQVDARHTAGLTRLRRDLSTMAVVADGRLTDTQEQLYQLVTARRGANDE